MSDEWEEYEAQKAKARAEVEELGERRVRHMLSTNQMPGSHLEAAEEWIASIDAAALREKETAHEASQAEQLTLARSAKDAAWAASAAAERAATAAERDATAAERAATAVEVANKRATIALIIAAISIIITAVGIWISYRG